MVENLVAAGEIAELQAEGGGGGGGEVGEGSRGGGGAWERRGCSAGRMGFRVSDFGVAG